MSIRLAEYSQTLTGMEAYCVKEFAEALEVIPLTLAENAGLHPIAVVTELRQKHADGLKTAGINVRKVCTYRAFASCGCSCDVCDLLSRELLLTFWRKMSYNLF